MAKNNILTKKITSEYIFSINDINQPKLVKDQDQIYLYLVRLFLLNPGTIQSNPDMGIGIVANYRYGFDEDISKLKTVAKDQIQKYLPQFEIVNVEIAPEYQSKSLVITITLDNNAYQLTYDSELQNFINS